MNVVRVDSFVPDYKRCCEVCGDCPVVTAIVSGEPIEFGGTLCGPCTWGEAAMRDPANWNN